MIISVISGYNHRRKMVSVIQKVETVVRQHYEYLLKNDFKGWDVFDGLNSKLLQKTPFFKSRLFRLAWIQFFKRSPINFRTMTLVPKGHNPKALALFISALINLAKYYKNDAYFNQAKLLYERLIRLKSAEFSGAGWGYNFPWQARAFYVPAFKPNMVVSVFSGHAFLDLYQFTSENEYEEAAIEVGKFIIDNLILSENKNTLCFAYIPGEQAVVHNANLLGAGYLSRLFSITGNPELKKKAAKSIRFSVDSQREDGAWIYGEKGHHQWVDNFHTGYNLMSVFNYQYYCEDNQFESSILKGLAYHLKCHFTKNGLPKYTDKSLYPIDIHCFSQALLTSIRLRSYFSNTEGFVAAIIQNAFQYMFDNKKNYFYYQKHKLYFIKISYIRWSQAWMFFALTKYLNYEQENSK